MINPTKRQKRQKGAFFSELLNSQKEYPVKYLIPLIAALSFIPLILFLYEYNTGFDKYPHIQISDAMVDFFLHPKMIWLYITFITIILLLVYMKLDARIHLIQDKILIPLFAYAGLCLISAFTSIDMHYSFSGIFDQFEAVWMLLGYALLVYYAFFTIKTEKALRCMIPWFNTGVTLMSLLGILQITGHDPLFNETFQKLIFINDPGWIGKIAPSFGSGRPYLSLYNPNYVGFYAVLVVPLLLILFIHTKRLPSKIAYGLLISVQIMILFASQSRAGIFVLLFALLLLLFYLRRYLMKNWIPVIAILAIAIIAFIGYNALNQNILINRMLSMFQLRDTNLDLEDIVTDKDVTIYYKGNSIHFSTTPGETGHFLFSVTDDGGKEIPYTPSEDGAANVITDSRFPFQFGETATEDLTGFWVQTPKINMSEDDEVVTSKIWTFTNTMVKNDTSYYCVSSITGKLFKMKKHEKGIPFLEKHATMANGRGFIWARTIPLLKKYFLFGSGPDTFTLAFPNDDLVGIMNGQHDGETVTRPHCLYLQIAVQTGVPSLIAYLTFFFWYIGSSILLYRKQDFSKLLPKAGIGILASVIGYLILGITNDSCIAVAPIFYILTGIGLGINYRLKAEKQAASARK